MMSFISIVQARRQQSLDWCDIVSTIILCLKYIYNSGFLFLFLSGHTRTRTNRSGGIQGGISNGESIVIRVAFKPTSTISKEQM